MDFGISRFIPTDYTGPQSNIAPLRSFPREPLTTDKKYPIGQLVILSKDPSTGTEGDIWYLSKFDSSGNAIWLQLSVGAGSPGIDTITTDDGSPAVEPDANGNVNILGGDGIDVTGQGPGSTVTISAGTDVATSYPTDSGTATPTGNELDIVGGSNMNTAGATNIVTVNLDDDINVHSVTIDPQAAEDGWLQFSESSTAKWRIGNDETNDSFRISQGNALGTNDTFIMTASGERTMPLQPAFLAVLDTTDTDVTGAGTQYTVGTNTAYVERFDQGGDFATSPCTFTAPIDAKYMLNFTWAIEGMDAGMTSMSNRIITSNETFNVCRENPYDDRNTDTGRTGQVGSVLCEMDAADTSTFTIQISGSVSGNDADLTNAQSSNAICGWLVV